MTPRARIPRARPAGARIVPAPVALALVALAMIAGAREASAQERRDSTVRDSTARDSVAIAIVAEGGGRDTTVVWERRNAVDTVVVYSAKDSIVYSIRGKTMRMYRDAAITYGSMAIAADTITLNWSRSTIAAGGVRDSSGEADSVRGSPRLSDGGESYAGSSMTYNFKTKQGVITMGETAIDNGFCTGDRIKRASEDTYFIAGGSYSTCDLPRDKKHYYFGAPRMKVVPNDLIVAEPIVLYIEDIPLFALPFAVIPSKSGRSSGIIIPSFGEWPSRGRYLRNGGYYLAMSDYWDATLTGDVYSKGGFRVAAEARYKLRYSFEGSVAASYGRQRFAVGSWWQADDEPQTDYSFSLRHNQTIDPSSSLSADLTFLSNSYTQNFSNSVNELLRQTVRSAAYYSKSWETRSINVNIEREQNLQDGTSTNTLPVVTFTQSQIYPFRSKNFAGDGAWYEMIGFTYSANAINTHNSYARTVYDPDTAEIVEAFDRRGINHTVSLLSSPKLGYLTLQPSFTYRERWYDHRLERSWDSARAAVVARDVRGFFALRTFNLGLTASTKLYGTVTPGILGIEGIRHTVQPSVSWSWYPDFSSAGWGYYRSYRDTSNREIRYDPYTGYAYLPGEPYGGVTAGESQTMSMGLSNIFEMKLAPAAGDSTRTPRKFQLLSLNLSSSYNFAADSLRLSSVNVNYRTAVQNVVDLSGSAVFSPYVYQRSRWTTDSAGRRVQVESGHEVNRYRWSEGQGLARLTSAMMSVSTMLTSDMFASRDTARSLDAMARAAPAWSVPWNLSMGLDFSYNQYNPDYITRSANLRLSGGFSPTRNWEIRASTYYDLVTRQLGTPEITVHRDLHCWEMNFTWVPAGYYRHFELVIRLRAPQLQDIKLEKKGSDRGVFAD